MANITVPVDQIDFKIIIVCIDNGSVVDVSSVSTKQIKIWKPSGTLLTKTALFETDGTDGTIYYNTITDDLDETGWYKIRGYFDDGSFTGHTAKGEFLVEEL